MTVFKSFILGAVQGLTEFLPVSSSAHLVFVQHLLGFKEQLVFFDVVLHLATLIALLVYFAADIAHLIRDSIYGMIFLLQRKPLQQISEIAPHSRWALGILVASVPTGLMGIFLKDYFENLFGSLRGLGFQLIITTLLLAATPFFRKNEKSINQAKYLDFLIIGILQGISITPGISRSGATIAAALYLGFRSEDAFRFSFLLSIPAILGAGLVEWEGLAGWQSGWAPLAVGSLAAGILGYLALHFLARVMRRGQFHWFAAYTFFFAILIFTLAGRFE